MTGDIARELVGVNVQDFLVQALRGVFSWLDMFPNDYSVMTIEMDKKRNDRSKSK